MKTYYFTFRSITLAQRGEKVLREAGIRCAMQRTPRWMEEQGCGYALRLWVEAPGEAAGMLRERQLAPRRVYAQGKDGLKELSV